MHLGDNNSNPLISISANYEHTLGMCSDGTVYSFGANSVGQLGNGQNIASSAPETVVGVNNAGVLDLIANECPTLATNLQTGLVGYWPFCGNANDESGNGNNGTVNGATLTTDRFGNANSAYSFDGVNSYIDIQNAFFNNGQTNYSISVWVKPTVLGGIIMNSVPHDGFGIGCGTFALNSNPQFHLWDIINPSSIETNFNTQILTNAWNQVTIVKQAGFVYYYRNGVLDKTVDISSAPVPISFNVAVRLGQIAPGWYPEPFSGLIDDVCIWNRALTPTEITQLYTDPSITSPVACTPFLGEDQTVCAGTSVQLNAISTGVSSGLALLETYSHDVGSAWTHDFSVVPGQSYTVRVSAQFSMGTVCPNFEMDPAYWIPPYNGGVALTHGCNSAWYIQNYCNGALGMRPTPDVYNPQHTYDYPIVANSNVLTVGFADCCFGDNCGSISFELYNLVSTSSSIDLLVWSSTLMSYHYYLHHD
jgi:hypothetical protein